MAGQQGLPSIDRGGMIMMRFIVRETIWTADVIECNKGACFCSRDYHVVSFYKADINRPGSDLIVIISPLYIFN